MRLRPGLVVMGSRSATEETARRDGLSQGVLPVTYGSRPTLRWRVGPTYRAGVGPLLWGWELVRPYGGELFPPMELAFGRSYEAGIGPPLWWDSVLPMEVELVLSLC